MYAALNLKDKKQVHWYPTGDQRIDAGKTLLKKWLPDKKAIEYSGESNLVVDSSGINHRGRKPKYGASVVRSGLSNVYVNGPENDS